MRRQHEAGGRAARGGARAERRRPGKLGERTAVRALGPGLREPDTAAAAAAAAVGAAQGTPPLPVLCLSPSLLPRGRADSAP